MALPTSISISWPHDRQRILLRSCRFTTSASSDGDASSVEFFDHLRPPWLLGRLRRCVYLTMPIHAYPYNEEATVMALDRRRVLFLRPVEVMVVECNTFAVMDGAERRINRYQGSHDTPSSLDRTRDALRHRSDEQLEARAPAAELFAREPGELQWSL